MRLFKSIFLCYNRPPIYRGPNDPLYLFGRHKNGCMMRQTLADLNRRLKYFTILRKVSARLIYQVITIKGSFCNFDYYCQIPLKRTQLKGITSVEGIKNF